MEDEDDMGVSMMREWKRMKCALKMYICLFVNFIALSEKAAKLDLQQASQAATVKGAAKAKVATQHMHEKMKVCAGAHTYFVLRAICNRARRRKPHPPHYHHGCGQITWMRAWSCCVTF